MSNDTLKAARKINSWNCSGFVAHEESENYCQWCGWHKDHQIHVTGKREPDENSEAAQVEQPTLPLSDSQIEQAPTPRYSWGPDGKSVMFLNFEECMAYENRKAASAQKTE